MPLASVNVAMAASAESRDASWGHRARQAALAPGLRWQFGAEYSHRSEQGDGPGLYKRAGATGRHHGSLEVYGVRPRFAIRPGTDRGGEGGQARRSFEYPGTTGEAQNPRHGLKALAGVVHHPPSRTHWQTPVSGNAEVNR